MKKLFQLSSVALLLSSSAVLSFEIKETYLDAPSQVELKDLQAQRQLRDTDTRRHKETDFFIENSCAMKDGRQ